MATQWLRRTWLLAACASALLLASCGGGSIESSLTPTRVVAFGDAMGDLGQNGRRYTINDSGITNWTQYVANAFALTLAPSAAGGLSFATGNARVTAEPDAAGSADTLTVREQIDTFLGGGGRLGESDLVLVSAGTSDVITQVQAVLTGGQSQETMQANLTTAARELGAQVRRLVDAGGRHVVVAGPYNLGRSPWAIQTSQSALMEAASSRFNQQLLVAMVDLGANVLYVDAALQFNLVTANPTGGDFELSDVNTLACNSVDPGPGIGTGAGQVNSNLCTPATLTPGTDSARLLFADRVYPTPRGHQIFGDFAFNRIRERW
jgi:outer membrane lipase/esterase